jgi:hypothetical protein
MAVCCQNLTLRALNSRSAVSVLVGALFKKFGLFLNTPRRIRVKCEVVRTSVMLGRNAGFKKETVCSSKNTLLLNIQGDSRGQFDVLVGNNIRHCEKKNVCMKIRLILSCCRIYEYKRIVIGTEEREINYR